MHNGRAHMMRAYGHVMLSHVCMCLPPYCRQEFGEAASKERHMHEVAHQMWCYQDLLRLYATSTV